MNVDDAQLAPVILGYNGRDLWFVVNFVIVGWIPLCFLPRWKYTAILPLLPAMMHAVVYTVSITTAIRASDGNTDMSTFDGVHKGLSDPNVTLPAWLHYCMADLLIGRWVYMDSMERGSTLTFHFLIMVPCLVLTCMLCPCGLLLYLVAIRPLLPRNKTNDTKEE